VHTVQKTPFGNMKSVVTADGGWSESPMGNQDLEGEDLEKAQEELKTDMVAIMRDLDGLACQALAPAEVDGVPTNPVHVSGVGDSYQIIFLGAEDNLVKMVQTPSTSPMTGAPVTMKVYVDEYQETDGFTMPKKIRITYDDEEFGIGTVESFVANPDVDMALFSK
jgi:hypothetical protein